MKRGHSTKEIWLRAKGEMPSFRFRPTRAAQESETSWHTGTIANAASRPSIYQIVTDRIISSLKAGMKKWFRFFGQCFLSGRTVLRVRLPEHNFRLASI